MNPKSQPSNQDEPRNGSHLDSDKETPFAKRREGFPPRPSRVLVTGGAGFIGSHLVDRLLGEGYEVRVLDYLFAQVHGTTKEPPAHLNPAAEFIRGDVRHPETVSRALQGVDAVFHLAAIVGVGQSMYQIDRYTSTNNLGTAVLLQALIEQPVARLVVASSMSIYGEGLYREADGTRHSPVARSVEQLAAGRWEMATPEGRQLFPLPTPETKEPALSSIYALSKFDQERMCLMIGQAYKIPTVALRFFNVYGPRQALSNPYTGVLAIFGSRFLNQKHPLIFEDGEQRRDFVSVHDIVRACQLALESSATHQVFNIGSGESYTVRDIASRLGERLGRPELTPIVNGKYRVGDIRHCFADISLARRWLGYTPRVSLEQGLDELAEWLASQVAVDSVESAHMELSARGLTI